jgi:hypothetical protein
MPSGGVAPRKSARIALDAPHTVPSRSLVPSRMRCVGVHLDCRVVLTCACGCQRCHPSRSCRQPVSMDQTEGGIPATRIPWLGITDSWRRAHRERSMMTQRPENDGARCSGRARDSPSVISPSPWTVSARGVDCVTRSTTPIWTASSGRRVRGCAQEWALFAIGFESLVQQFFEIDPDWGPDAGGA